MSCVPIREYLVANQQTHHLATNMVDDNRVLVWINIVARTNGISRSISARLKSQYWFLTVHICFSSEEGIIIIIPISILIGNEIRDNWNWMHSIKPTSWRIANQDAVGVVCEASVCLMLTGSNSINNWLNCIHGIHRILYKI